jgi:TPR repeat protein
MKRFATLLAAVAVTVASNDLSRARAEDLHAADVCYGPAQQFLTFAMTGFTRMYDAVNPDTTHLKADALTGCLRLAEKGDRRSQAYMAVMALNPDEAKLWYRKAAEQGDMPSIERNQAFADNNIEKLKWSLVYKARMVDWPKIKWPDEDPVSPLQKRWVEAAVTDLSKSLTPTQVAQARAEAQAFLKAHPARR